MRESETIAALERGLITEAEAIEQACVDDLDSLYRQAAGWSEHRRREWRPTAPAQVAGYRVSA